jgi:hypothetical protein
LETGGNLNASSSLEILAEAQMLNLRSRRISSLSYIHDFSNDSIFAMVTRRVMASSPGAKKLSIW